MIKITYCAVEFSKPAAMTRPPLFTFHRRLTLRAKSRQEALSLVDAESRHFDYFDNRNRVE